MSKVTITGKWEYDTDTLICSNTELGGNIFVLKDKCKEKVESSFPSERLNAMQMYECISLRKEINVPLGIIRRAIEIQEISKTRDIVEYQLEAYNALSKEK